MDYPTNSRPDKTVAILEVRTFDVDSIDVDTLLAGEMWMDGARPNDGWFVSNVTLDAFLGYTLPLFQH